MKNILKIMPIVLIFNFMLGLDPTYAAGLRIPVGVKGDRAEAVLEMAEVLKGGRQEIIKAVDRWSVSGKYDKVAQLLQLTDSRDGDIVKYLTKTQKKIEALKRCHELIKKGFAPVIVPDGKGGFFVDTLGFAGKWIARNRTGKTLDNGYMLRLLKSISTVTGEIKENLLKTAGFITKDAGKITFGKIYIVGGIKDIGQIRNKNGIIFSIPGIPDIAVEVIAEENGRQEAVFYVTPAFVEKDRIEQRKILMDIFTLGVHLDTQEIMLSQAEEVKNQREQKTASGPIQLVGLNESSNIGINLLGQILENRGVKTSYNFFLNESDWILSARASGRAYDDLKPNERILEEYGAEFQKAVQEMEKAGSKIICISVTTPMIDKANLLFDIIKKEIPDATIIIGGPVTRTPEQLAALMPKADILIRGEADEIFPKIIDILKNHTGSEDLSEEQIRQITSLEGGVFVKAGSIFIVNDLHKTNVVDNFHLAEPRDDKRDNTLFTSRGCPYNCSFCNLSFGRRFRAVANEEVIDWLIKRLALKFPDKTPKAIRDLVEKGENLFKQGLALPLRIEIWDDNFFLDKKRIKDLSEKINKLGLDKYFIFSIEGGSTRALYKNGNIDTELVEALWKGGFRSIKFGTDGLSDAVLAQNNKGYTFDKVVALNKYLREKGFFVRHNLIYATPQTSLKEFFENMFLDSVFPKVGKGSENPGILGDQATWFSELDVLNFSEAYRWDEGYFATNSDAIYFDKDEYMVPRQTEYAYRKYTPFKIADRKVEGVVRDMIRDGGMETKWIFARLNISQDLAQEVTSEWEKSESKELRALAKITIKMREETGKSMALIGFDIQRQLYEFGIHSFTDYVDKIYKNHSNIYGLKLDDVTTVRECLVSAKEYIRIGFTNKAAKELYKAERLQPDNLELYYAEAALITLMRNYGDAIKTICEGIKNSNINVPVYFADRTAKLESLILHRLLNEFMGKGAEDYERVLYESAELGFQTEETLKAFGLRIDIVMHNAHEYVNYFNQTSNVISLIDLPGGLSSDKQMKEGLKGFIKKSLLDFLGDDDERIESLAMRDERLFMNSMILGDHASKSDNFIGKFYGEDEKDTSKAQSVFIPTIFHDAMEHNDFQEEGDKRIYIVYPSKFTLVRMEANDIVATSLTFAAYAIVRGKKDGKIYIGVINMLIPDIASEATSSIVRSHLEDPEIILVMDKTKKEYGKNFIENLRWNGLKCKCIWTDSSHLAIAADLDGYVIFDRQHDKFIRVTLWNKSGEKDAALVSRPYLKFSEILTSETIDANSGTEYSGSERMHLVGRQTDL